MFITQMESAEGTPTANRNTCVAILDLYILPLKLFTLYVFLIGTLEKEI